MRVALVVPGFSRHADDWAIPALQNFARSLSQAHEVYTFSQRYPSKGRYHFDGLIHDALGGGQRFGLPSVKLWQQTARAIIAQHQQSPFDLIHAFWADEAGLSAVLAGMRIKRPVVVSLGGGELTNLPQLNYGAQRFWVRRVTTQYALKKATLVTAGSKHQLDLCRAHQVPESKLRLAPLGIDTDQFQPIHPLTNQLTIPPTIVQAASLLPVKNQTLLLKVVSLIKADRPEIRLNLVGSGPLQTELAKLAQKLDLSHNIRWCQQVAHPEMPGLYQQSQLYLQTSYHESQGMAALEAMACGLPALGTPVGVVNELACRPPLWEKEMLAAQVIDVLGDKLGYMQLSRQARETIEKEFSLPVTTANFLSIYRAASQQGL